jgi:UDP-2-acetamido-3-amino-2,3-dideoxy-glucuronate N-acetyltransferase
VRYLYSNRLNIGKIRTEENILWSFAPHDISVILGLLGEVPMAVSCQGNGWLNPEVADVTVSQFDFASGVKAHIFVSWLHPFKEQRLVVVGADKMAVFDDTAEHKLLLYPHKVEWKDRVPTAVKAEAEIVDLPESEPLKAECMHFLECCKTRKAPVSDGVEGQNVLRILDACQVSLGRKGAPVELAAQTAPTEKKLWYAHPTAFVDEPVDIGEGTKIWHYSHVMKGAKIGRKCVFGQNVNIDGGTVIGNNVKVQNNVSIYTGLIIEDDVFLGPSCVMTNVTNPRCQVNRHSLYETTIIRRGASVGANATIVCGITLGRYCLIGSGSVVTKDVPDYAMMVGVPARKLCWVSRHGLPLKSPDADGVYTCPESRLRYKENAQGELRCLDIDEEAPLPENMTKGGEFYDQIVHGRRLTGEQA